MKIQWFPGHMTKALRMMEEEIKVVDIILYVLDSRAPKSCENPKFVEVAGNRPIIYVLNKADLVEREELKKWIKYYSRENSAVITLNSTNSGSGNELISIIKKLLKDKLLRYKDKNVNMTVRGMVIGVPNTGKSTLINNLSRKAKTVTGNKPGVTRGKQWVTIDNGIELLDTPGTLWPSFEDEDVAFNLAFIGSIKDDVLDLENLAFEFIKKMCIKNKTVLENRYQIKIEETDEPIDIFDKICIFRNALLKGGELDYEKCSKLILDDFRKGRMGKIILD